MGGDALDRQGIQGLGGQPAERVVHHPQAAQQHPNKCQKPYSRAAFIAEWDDMSLSIAEVAAKFGISHSQCTRRAKALGLQHRKDGARPKRTNDAFIRAAWLAGVKSSDICRRAGIEDGALWARVRAMGLDLRGSGKRSTMTLMEFDALQLRLALAASARETAAAMRDAEMIDNFQAARWPARRAA